MSLLPQSRFAVRQARDFLRPTSTCAIMAISLLATLRARSTDSVSPTDRRIVAGWLAIITTFWACGILALAKGTAHNEQDGLSYIVRPIRAIDDSYAALAAVGLLALVAVIILLLISRARFFFLGSSILTGQAGFLLFDQITVRFPASSGDTVIVDVARSSDWRIHVGLVIAAGAMLLIDHVRRPPG